ncbi:alpha/beta fold hydrolase, partial [Kitasatospora sp. NPDC093102]|uniref:thioesterase domain-containing protein n=1 Tax=Kitasatospora sp. NPDC093102 TaxID=3155069 RepID=UPI003440BD00
IWADTLATPHLGIHDNFFDLGGHSLLATKAAKRLRNAGLDVTVRQIMQWQTAAELAAALGGDATDGNAKEQDEAEPLVYRLSAGEPDPALPKLFCVHASGGTPNAYGQLARLLRADCTTYGIQAVGMDRSEPPLSDVATMAERYWEAIKSVQPEGPYHLLGWSLGGVLAHEIARQGATETATVFLVEPPVHGPRLEARLRPGVELYVRAAELWERGQGVAPESRAALAAELRRVAEPLEVPADSVGLDEWLPYETLGHLLDAMLRHRPGVSAAPAVLFVSDEVAFSREGSTVNERDLAEYLGHWEALHESAPAVERTPGDHGAMMTELAAIEKVAKVVRGTVRAGHDNHDRDNENVQVGQAC